MRAYLRTMITVMLIGFTFGCSRNVPVLRTQESLIPDGGTIDIEKVENAIKSAAVALTWNIKKIRPGLFEAELMLRGHEAVVEIPYSASSYSIVYKSSKNLKYDGETIHRNYNSWVRNLDQGIQRQLAFGNP